MIQVARNRLSLIVVALTLAALCALAGATGAGASGTSTDRLLAPSDSCRGGGSSDASAAAQRAAMVCLIDYSRAQLGLPALQESPILDRVGALKIARDIRCDDFTHTPCGQPWTAVYTAAGYSLSAPYAVGENLAYGKDALGAPRMIMRAWLNSPDHRANLLSKSWTRFGLAVQPGAHFLDYDGVSIWANEFASA